MRQPKTTNIATSVVFAVGMRWTDRVIGFVSTLVLARLLTPEDFGIIAMASLVIGLVDVFFNLGVNVALIQNHSTTQDHFDSAWTLRLIQTSLATLIVILAAPFAVDYYHAPAIKPVLIALALSFLLSGFENIGVVNFQKEMQFGAEFRFLFIRRLVGVLTTIVAAWYLQSYWALVIGTLAGRAGGVVLSYVLHPMRPRLSLKKCREIFSVSQWMLLRSIGGYMEFNLHKMLVGRRDTAALMGGYTIADEIAAIPSTELLSPINRVLFPAFVRAKHDLVQLKKMFLLAQGIQCLVAIPAGVGLALVAEEAVLLFLGQKWLFVAPFLELLALMNVIISVTTSAGYVLITLGKIRTVAIYAWLQAALFLTGALIVIPHAQALEIAWLRLTVAVVGICFFGGLLLRALPGLTMADMLNSILRPVLSALSMALALVYIGDSLLLPLPAVLLIKICVGVTAYSASIMFLWWIARCPDGPEMYFIQRLVPILTPANNPK